MSITFHSDAPCPTVERHEPCLCAQDAPGFPRTDPQTLAQHALSTCPWCHGTGLWFARDRDEPALNVASLNAASLIGLLGLPEEVAGGSVPLPVMRRALMRARNTLARRAPRFTREPQRANRFYSHGLSTERLAAYLTALERLCLFAQARGGTLITWD